MATTLSTGSGWCTRAAGLLPPICLGFFALLCAFITLAGHAQAQSAAPQVTSVWVPAAATYRAGEQLTFTVNFDQNVTVTGTPTLALTTGDFDPDGFSVGVARRPLA